MSAQRQVDVLTKAMSGVALTLEEQKLFDGTIKLPDAELEQLPWDEITGQAEEDPVELLLFLSRPKVMS